MRLVTSIARAVTLLNLWIARIVAYGTPVIFVLLLSDVVMRYLVGRPLSWTGELAQLTFGFYAMLGGGYLLARREHVNVDLLFATFSRRRQLLIEISTSVLFFLFAGVLLVESWSLAADSVGRLETSHSVWNPPVWPVKCAIPVAAALILAQGAVKLVADVLLLAGIEVDESAFGPIHDREGDA